MELLIIVAVAVAVLAWFLWKDRQFEQSDSHPLDGPTKAPEPWPFPTSRPPEGEAKTTRPDGVGHESIPVMPTLTAALDVNKDGRVDLKDAVAAADILVEKTKKAAKKTKAAVKKTATNVKKVAKKATAKKPKK
jgi:hypothetical protein